MAYLQNQMAYIVLAIKKDKEEYEKKMWEREE